MKKQSYGMMAGTLDLWDIYSVAKANDPEIKDTTLI